MFKGNYVIIYYGTCLGVCDTYEKASRFIKKIIAAESDPEQFIQQVPYIDWDTVIDDAD